MGCYRLSIFQYPWYQGIDDPQYLLVLGSIQSSKKCNLYSISIKSSPVINKYDLCSSLFQLFYSNLWFILPNLMTQSSLTLGSISVAISGKLRIALPLVPNHININHSCCLTTSRLSSKEL